MSDRVKELIERLRGRDVTRSDLLVDTIAILSLEVDALARGLESLTQRVQRVQWHTHEPSLGPAPLQPAPAAPERVIAAARALISQMGQIFYGGIHVKEDIPKRLGPEIKTLSLALADCCYWSGAKLEADRRGMALADAVRELLRDTGFEVGGLKKIAISGLLLLKLRDALIAFESGTPAPSGSTAPSESQKGPG